MNMLFLTIPLIFIFFITMGFGYYITKKEKDSTFSFFTHFPFEIKSKNDKLLILFRALLVIVAGLCAFISLYSLYVEGNYILEKNLALLMVLNSILLVALFMIDTRKYKVHLVTSILFMLFNLGISFLVLYLPIRDNFVNYHLVTLILGVIIFVLQLVLTLLPSLKHWYVMEVDEAGNKSRGKVFPLALVEWIHILSFLSIFIILLINSLI